jgi:hypothetical protein
VKVRTKLERQIRILRIYEKFILLSFMLTLKMKKAISSYIIEGVLQEAELIPSYFTQADNHFPIISNGALAICFKPVRSFSMQRDRVSYHAAISRAVSQLWCWLPGKQSCCLL